MGSQRVRHDLVTKQQQTKAFYAGKLCDHTYFSEKALWQPHCEGCIAEGQVVSEGAWKRGLSLLGKDVAMYLFSHVISC